MKLTEEQRARAMNPGLEEQVITELRRIMRATQMSAKKLARQSGMTTSQLIVLQILQTYGEMTARQIAQSMNLTQATVTSLLDRLQERGWVTRERGREDRRRVHVRLTKIGQRRLERAPESLQQHFVTQFAALQPWEQSWIVAALQRVAHLLDAASIDASPVLDIGRIDREAGSDPGE